MESVIDVHVQLGTDEWLSHNLPRQIHGATGWGHTADLTDLGRWRKELREMDADLVAAVAFPFPSAPSRRYRIGNEVVAAAAERSSDLGLTILPLYAVNPFDRDEREWLSGLLAAGRPCAGIKLNPYLGMPGGYDLPLLADDPDLVELLVNNRLIVAMHVGTGREYLTRPEFPKVAAGPRDAIELARRLPFVPMLMLHMLRLSATALAAAAGAPNVFVETSGLSSIGIISEGGQELLFAESTPSGAETASGALKWAVSELGLEDRLVFGSASPFCTWWGSSQSRDVQMVLRSELNPIVCRKILAGNASTLFGLPTEPR